MTAQGWWSWRHASLASRAFPCTILQMFAFRLFVADRCPSSPPICRSKSQPLSRPAAPCATLNPLQSNPCACFFFLAAVATRCHPSVQGTSTPTIMGEFPRCLVFLGHPIFLRFWSFVCTGNTGGTRFFFLFSCLDLKWIF